MAGFQPVFTEASCEQTRAPSRNECFLCHRCHLANSVPRLRLFPARFVSASSQFLVNPWDAAGQENEAAILVEHSSYLGSEAHNVPILLGGLLQISGSLLLVQPPLDSKQVQNITQSLSGIAAGGKLVWAYTSLSFPTFNLVRAAGIQ